MKPLPSCPMVPLAVRIPGQAERLNLLCPLFGRTAHGRPRADFKSAARTAIQLIERKVHA